MSHPIDATGAEIVVLSSNGVAAALRELGPAFERASGNRLTVRYDATVVLAQAIEDGARFDLAILTASAIVALEQAGTIAAGSQAAMARAGIGIAVRAGAPKPDIATADALKRALLAAKSVAYTTAGASGIHFASVLQRLGIAAEVSAKAKLLKSGSTAVLVASGEAELAVQQISEILPVPGAELVGPLPPALQLYTVFAVGVGARAKEPAAARELARFLTAPEALPALRATGLEPG